MGKKLENKIEFVWTRKDFDGVCGRPLTDREWEVMASEVESETEESWFAKIIKDKFEIIEHLVEQDNKYE